MPVLANPRHEAFAQAILAGLSEPGKNTYKAAYIAAGYSGRGHSAEVVASRLLRKVEPIMARVRELQANQLARVLPKLDLSKERVGRRLNLASQIAEEERNASAIATSELGIAKVFGHLVDRVEVSSSTNFSNITSMQDIGRKLLEQVGFREPDDVSIAQAVEANNQLIEALERIRDTAQGHTLEHQD